MESKRVLGWEFPVILLLWLAELPHARAVTVPVGGASGWGLGYNYTDWAAQNPLYEGDTLLFRYDADEHNVNLLPSQQAFATCNFSGAVLQQPNSVNGDRATVLQPMTSPGPEYYVCSVDSHCDSGQKVAINVLPGPRPAGAPLEAPLGAPVAAVSGG